MTTIQPKRVSISKVTDLNQPKELVEFKGPEKLSQDQFNNGLRMNRVTTKLSGNSHFPGWFNVVQHDTELVVAQGTAYEGKSVKLGWESYDNATIVFAQNEAGFTHSQELDLAGKAGEDVRVIYYRVNQNSTFDESNGAISVETHGQSAAICGDPHWRDVTNTIHDTFAVDSAPSDEKFYYTQEDGYSDRYRAGISTVGKKAANEMGGDATEEKAIARSIDPMSHP